jgi:hypothetical protein
VSPDKIAFLVVNVVGGTAVLASYALWLANPSNDGAALWGSIGGPARALYTGSMLAAAAGYFAFAGYLLANDVEGLPWSWLLTLFALILFPSALWMPLAFEYLDAPGPMLWWAMRFTLTVVGIGSLLLVLALVRLEPRGTAHILAVTGAAAFTFQTLVLDALVWPLYFPR